MVIGDFSNPHVVLIRKNEPSIMVNKINTILFLEINGKIYSSTDYTI